jgi:hypothetical protein
MMTMRRPRTSPKQGAPEVDLPAAAGSLFGRLLRARSVRLMVFSWCEQIVD